MNDTNQVPDKRFLGVPLVFGIVAVCVSIHWMNAGSITIGRNPGRVSPGHVAGRAAGRMPADHILFHPLCATWSVLGACLVIFSCLAYVQESPGMYKLCGYCCLVLLLLTFGTLLTAVLVRGP